LDPRDTPTTFGGVGGKPWYVLTDAQGDLVSIAHLPTGSNAVAEVGGQWTYSPYGEVLTYEKLRPHPVVVFGHKTLAVDRLDVANPVQWDLEMGYISELPRLVPGARVFGYARNRTLDIARGRWLQNDPNASGVSLQSSTFHGGGSTAEVADVNLSARCRDGLSLNASYRSTPFMASDPLGLSIFALPPPQAIKTYVDYNKAVGAAGAGIAGWLQSISPMAYIGGVNLGLLGSAAYRGSTYGYPTAGSLLYGRDKLADTGFRYNYAAEAELSTEAGVFDSAFEGSAGSGGSGPDNDDGNGGKPSPSPKSKKACINSSQRIADGPDIRDVNRLVKTYGGRLENWRKRKGWDIDRSEWHWYENTRDGIGRKEWKPK
jgi:hypothetical protein